MTTKIQSISKTKTVDYSNELLQNFWQQKSTVSVTQNHKKEIVRTLQSVQEGIVCIQTESLTDKDLIKQIFDIAQNLKVRFYILVNEYSQELDLLNEICLIRYEVKNIGSFVLINPNSDKPEGRFFTGQLTEQSIAVTQNISRSLDTKETEELFRHFCFQFWETAKKEVIEKGKKSEVISKPLDVFHDTNVFEGKDFVYGTLFDFSEKAIRGELSEKQIILLNNETQIPIKIKANTTNVLSDNVVDSLLPKNEFENQEPNFADDGVSVSIEYSWQNIPFYLPEKATRSSLYERWKVEQTEILKQLDSLLNKIQETEKKEANISKAISRIFLGKKNVFSALKNEIDDLKEIHYAELPEAKLKERIIRINEINVQVQNEIGEIETANSRAKLDEEIENLKTQISDEEIALETKKKELESKKDSMDKNLDDFCLKYSIDKNKIGQEKSNLGQLAGDKNKKKNPKEAAEAEQKLSKLKEIQNTTFISKTESEIKDYERKINSLKNQIGAKEKEKNKQIQPTDSSSLNELIGDTPSKRSGAEKPKLVQIPNLDQLPTIGELFQVNSQHFLAIEFWEQYEQGKKEAERLKANLCAIK
jgi:hypothetical protein